MPKCKTTSINLISFSIQAKFNVYLDLIYTVLNTTIIRHQPGKMDESKKQFQIYLPGLLRILAENLYSSKKVAIRELIQNAHDSCIRRSTQGREPGYKPRIDISVDLMERVVRIQDNGSGLTADEVTDYLSTIGKSYTRELGEDLALLSPNAAQRLIGQFGLGFLSAFLMATEITLVTKSMKPDNPTLRWHSTGDIHYELTPIADGEVGTRVELRLKPEASALMNERVLEDAIRQYADFLDIPIYLGQQPSPVNMQMPPWLSVDPDIAVGEYIANTFGTLAPLAVIMLQDHTLDLGHDSLTIPLEGFLFVPPGSIASLQEYGDLNIYIRRMFICEHRRNLLPSWAKFVRGVVDCPYLEPTASREDIQQDEMFRNVQRALEEQLSAGLKQIARNDQRAWKRIVKGHRNIIMSWAVKEEAFFKEVAPIVTFRTTQGESNLPEYLSQTDRVIYYVTEDQGSQQDQLLGAGMGVPVIKALWSSEAFFLRKYAHYNKDVQLIEMEADARQLLRPVSDEAFRSLLEYYRQRGVRAQVVSFAPEDVPAVISYPQNAAFIKSTRDALDSGDVPGPFAGLVSDYVSKLDVDEEALAGTLHLNAPNTLIQKLAEAEAGQARDAALELIYHLARLFSGRMLDATDIAHAFKVSAVSIMQLLDSGD
jgi:molecular chaperone HtpG